jgi:hypothetical protein
MTYISIKKENRLAKRKQAIIRNGAINKRSPARELSPTTAKKQQTDLTSVDSLNYYKNDIKWSLFTAAIVIIVLIIAYIFLH